MRRILLLGGIVLYFSQCSVEQLEFQGNYDTFDNQELSIKGMERIGEFLFIEENGKRYSIDQKVITVKLMPGIDKIGENFKVLRSNELGYIDLSVPEDIDVEKYVSILKEKAEFETVEFNTIGEYCFTPNDTRINEQWYLNRINAYSAWDITTGSPSVKVAVLDSGVDWGHSDLGVGNDGYSNINTSLGWNYITNSNNVITINHHGTRVAGIVGAKTNNSRGIAGVSGGNNSLGITIIPYCVGIQAPNSSVVDDAIINATNKGARVIQMSLDIVSTSAINAAIDYAQRNNVVTVSASGNSYSSTVSYPASISLIAVGATDKNNRRANFSNYGTGLNIVAPGVDILSTILNDNYNSENGTSFAAPQVSAVAALILSVNPSLTYKEVAYIINRTANKLPGYSFSGNGINGTWNNQVGHGLLNAYAAVAMAQASQAGAGTILSVSGPISVNADNNGYARATLNISPANSNYTYLWSAVLYGQCVWNISASNGGYGSAADIDFQISPGQTGTLAVTCRVFNGSTYVGLASRYIDFSY